MQYVFYSYSVSQFGLATFQVLCSCIWLMATILDSSGISFNIHLCQKHSSDNMCLAELGREGLKEGCISQVEKFFMEFRMEFQIRMGGKEVRIGHSKEKTFWGHWEWRK